MQTGNSNPPPKSKARKTGRFLSAVRREFASLSFWATIASIAAGVAVLASGVLVVVALVEQQVRSRVDESMTPYQHLFSAINAVQNDDYWGGVLELKNALKACNPEESETGNLTLSESYDECFGENNVNTIIDFYLWAIASSHEVDLSEFHDDVAMIRKISGPAMMNNGWRLEKMGMYFLRMGSTELALQYLDASVSKHRGIQDFRSSASAHWDQALTLLLRDQDKAALEEFYAALRCSPRDFLPFIYRGEQFAISEEPIIAAVTRSQPRLKDKIRWLIETAQKDEKSIPIGYCKNYKPTYFSKKPLVEEFD